MTMSKPMLPVDLHERGQYRSYLIDQMDRLNVEIEGAEARSNLGGEEPALAALRAEFDRIDMIVDALLSPPTDAEIAEHEQQVAAFVENQRQAAATVEDADES